MRHALLALDVRAKVRQHEERIALHERAHDRVEESCLARREATLRDPREDFAKAGIGRDDLPGPVPLHPQRRHLVGGHPEQEEVIRPHGVADLHVGAVKGADGECAVHREFHIPRARSLEAGR